MEPANEEATARQTEAATLRALEGIDETLNLTTRDELLLAAESVDFDGEPIGAVGQAGARLLSSFPVFLDLMELLFFFLSLLALSL